MNIKNFILIKMNTHHLLQKLRFIHSIYNFDLDFKKTKPLVFHN